jgi:hypothetical protein
MVAKGEWTEEESANKLRECMAEISRNLPNSADVQRSIRNFNTMREFFSKIQGDHSLFEKEYIFDEGLGESLKDHVESIKNNFPGIEVLVRRDRDGYPVVKTLYKPKYKYSLEDIETVSYTHLRAHETLS